MTPPYRATANVDPRLTIDLARHYVRIALGHVSREYPHKADHVMDGPGDVYLPRRAHPVFYGSFDWHSCVHGFWLLVRLRRMFPAMPEAAAIEALIDERFADDNIRAELAYLARASSRGFERPYGWAWLLKLAAELRADTSPRARPWASSLAPLADAFAARFKAFLPLQTYPVRAGSHANSAFALILASDYAASHGDQALHDALVRSARAWFGTNAGAQAWEPSGEDFLSPTLCAAQAMRRLLPDDEFRAWLARYLPELHAAAPASLFIPAIVSDRSDGRIGHLDGLNLSRAWAWRDLAGVLAGKAREAALAAAQAHLDAGMPHVAGDYMGEHWLATYAVLAMSER